MPGTGLWVGPGYEATLTYVRTLYDKVPTAMGGNVAQTAANTVVRWSCYNTASCSPEQMSWDYVQYTYVRTVRYGTA